MEQCDRSQRLNTRSPGFAYLTPANVTSPETLYALDETIRGISVDLPGDPRTLELTNVYHNLVRHHAEP